MPTSRRVVVTEIAYRPLLKRWAVVARFYVDIITSNLFFSLFSTRLPLSTFLYHNLNNVEMLGGQCAVPRRNNNERLIFWTF